MAVEFRWHEGSGRESLTPPPRRPRRRSPRSIILLGGLLATIFAAAGLVIWNKAGEGRRAARADLQAVVDAELDALQRGDEEVYLSLQDYRQRQWYRHQELYWDALQRGSDDGLSGQVSELHIADFDLGDQRAWVEVEYELERVPYRRVQFYRFVEGHWRRSAPDAAYWGQSQELETARLRFMYHEREEAIALLVSEPLDRLFELMASDFGLEWSQRLVTFEFRPVSDAAPALYAEAHFLVPSPLLLGVRYDGRPDEELLASLAHSLSRWMAIEKSGLYVRQPGPGSSWLMLNGIAAWEVESVSGREALPSQWTDWLNEAVIEDTLLPLSALWPPYELRTDREGGLAMAQAQSVVDYAVHLRGKTILPLLLDTLGLKLSAEGTIQAVLEMGLASFESGWLEFVAEEVWVAEDAAPPAGFDWTVLQKHELSELLALSLTSEGFRQRDAATWYGPVGPQRLVWMWGDSEDRAALLGRVDPGAVMKLEALWDGASWISRPSQRIVDLH